MITLPVEVDNTAKEKTASIQGAKSLTTYNLVIGTYDANNNFGGETVQAFTTGQTINPTAVVTFTLNIIHSQNIAQIIWYTQ